MLGEIICATLPNSSIAVARAGTEFDAAYCMSSPDLAACHLADMIWFINRVINRVIIGLPKRPGLAFALSLPVENGFNF